MRNSWYVTMLVLLGAALFFVAACDESDAEDGDEGRPTCSQATDCGSEGRTAWVCSPEGECFSVDEYCYSDDECNGACVDHLCDGGKIGDGDADGDEPDGDGGLPDGDGPCQHQCCEDADCPAGSHCDLTNHICVLNNACQYECCSTDDCVDSAVFGEGYICRFNKCVEEDAPCTTECCEDADCSTGYVCRLGQCVEASVSCNPGDRTCCSSKPGVAACSEAGSQSNEAVLTCNGAGDGYTLTMCDRFNDCIDLGDGTTECYPNGRCETDADCPCTQSCLDGENGLRCQSPTVALGDTCYGTCEGIDSYVELGRCPDGASCCYDDAVNPTSGVCAQTCD